MTMMKSVCRRIRTFASTVERMGFVLTMPSDHDDTHKRSIFLNDQMIW